MILDTVENFKVRDLCLSMSNFFPSKKLPLCLKIFSIFFSSSGFRKLMGVALTP